MKQHATATKLVAALVVIVFIIGFSALGQKQEGKRDSFRNEQQEKRQDTTTRNKRAGMENHEHLKRVDEAMKQMDEQMKQLNIQLENIDLSRMEAELARVKIDEHKMKQQLEAALAQVDFEKIGKQVQASLNAVDWKKIDNDIKQGLSQVKEEDMEKLKAELEKVRSQIQTQVRVSVDKDKIRQEVENAMKSSKIEVEKARAEVEHLNKFTDALHADGLINKNKGYKIEMKDGELIINGKKQPKAVSDKYKEHYKKENFSIINDTSTRI